MEQAKAADGLRYTRFAIVRQTLKQLKDTVLKDIEQWLKGLVNYKVSDNTVYVHFGDVRSEWLLIPLDDPEDQRRLLSMQLTGAWLNECIEMDTDIVPPVLGRCGRYPGMGMKPEDHVGDWPTWYGAIADTNFPSEGSNWHKFMELETPPDWAIFKQPGGMEINAENIENLPGGRIFTTSALLEAIARSGYSGMCTHNMALIHQAPPSFAPHSIVNSTLFRLQTINENGEIYMPSTLLMATR
jgi:hypothetical protein